MLKAISTIIVLGVGLELLHAKQQATEEEMQELAIHRETNLYGGVPKVEDLASAGELLTALRSSPDSEKYHEQLNGLHIPNLGWEVIVNETYGWVSSTGVREFSAMEDYSGVKLALQTQPDFQEEIQVGDALTIWGKVIGAHAAENWGFVSVLEVRVESREQPGWWAKHRYEYTRWLPTSLSEALPLVAILYFVVSLIMKVVRFLQQRHNAESRLQE